MGVGVDVMEKNREIAVGDGDKDDNKTPCDKNLG